MASKHFVCFLLFSDIVVPGITPTRTGHAEIRAVNLVIGQLGADADRSETALPGNIAERRLVSTKGKYKKCK
jgi:hypothetical protein